MSLPAPEAASPPAIRSPLVLLYWVFFRGLALRRYAQSIHEDLDEDLKVWQVRVTVGNDPRFRALCRARSWLLLGSPLLGTLLFGGIAALFLPGFGWSPALLAALGWTIGAAQGDWLLWRFPQRRFIAFSLLGLILVFVYAGLSLLALPYLNVLAVGVGVGVAFGVAFLRLPMYLWELPLCFWLSGRAARMPAQAALLWRRQPLHYDEVIQLRLVGLAKHIAAIARHDPERCREALADVGSSLRQGWAVPQALRLIALAELERCTTLERIERFAEATSWLPLGGLPQAEHALIEQLQRASTMSALGAESRKTRENNLRAEVEQLRSQRTLLGKGLIDYAPALLRWEQIIDEAADQVAQQRADLGELPLPYAGGAVLRPGEPGFQGRADLFRTLEDLLANAAYRIAPLLLGQPRTGKTSALMQLPQRLGPQVIAVFLDMESRSSTNSAASLLGDIAGAIRTAALSARSPLSLPPLDTVILQGDPYRAFENWIGEVERALGDRRWLLLTLDEFRRIDEAVHRQTPGGLDERIFHLLRNLIQHHPQVGVALCGTFTLAECDPRWIEALKSVQYVPVSYLRPEEARRVLSHPHPSFPPNVYSEAALDRAVALSGGQPYLLQILGIQVIRAYNAERQGVAPGTPVGTPLPATAIEAAIPAVLSSAEMGLGSIWQWLLDISPAPAAAAPLLRGLARGEGPSAAIDPALRDELLELYVSRDLLEETAEGYRYRVPLLAMWIAQQRRLPGMAGPARTG